MESITCTAGVKSFDLKSGDFAVTLIGQYTASFAAEGKDHNRRTHIPDCLHMCLIIFIPEGRVIDKFGGNKVINIRQNLFIMIKRTVICINQNLDTVLFGKPCRLYMERIGEGDKEIVSGENWSKIHTGFLGAHVTSPAVNNIPSMIFLL